MISDEKPNRYMEMNQELLVSSVCPCEKFDA